MISIEGMFSVEKGSVSCNVRKRFPALWLWRRIGKMLRVLVWWGQRGTVNSSNLLLLERVLYEVL